MVATAAAAAPNAPAHPDVLLSESPFKIKEEHEPVEQILQVRFVASCCWTRHLVSGTAEGPKWLQVSQNSQQWHTPCAEGIARMVQEYFIMALSIPRSQAGMDEEDLAVKSTGLSENKLAEGELGGSAGRRQRSAILSALPKMVRFRATMQTIGDKTLGNASNLTDKVSPAAQSANLTRGT